jgi:hypothetical protein
MKLSRRSRLSLPSLVGLACAAVLGAVAPRASAQPAPPLPPATAAAAPSPEDKREAAERFERGVKFHKDAEYQAALIEFKRAYELAPNYLVLYTLGQTSRELKDHAGALRYFERYLEGGGKAIAARRRRDVEQWVEELRRKVARVTLDTAPQGAEITVDDVVVGKTPLSEPLVLNAGRRKINATLSGHLPMQRYVDVAGSEEVKVALELTPLTPLKPPQPPLQPAPQPTLQPAPLPAPPPRREGGSALPWVGLAATGALSIGWGVVGVMTLRAQSDFEVELSRRTTSKAVAAARSKVRGLALATDILSGVTVVSGALTVVAFAVNRGGEAAAPEQGKAAGARRANDAGVSRVEVRIGPGSVGLLGRF